MNSSKAHRENLLNAWCCLQIRVAGGWTTGVEVRVYAQMPTADAIAQRAGFSSQNLYMILHLILDPTTMPEFRGMTRILWDEVEDMLSEMEEV